MNKEAIEAYLDGYQVGTLDKEAAKKKIDPELMMFSVQSADGNYRPPDMGELPVDWAKVKSGEDLRSVLMKNFPIKMTRDRMNSVKHTKSKFYTAGRKKAKKDLSDMHRAEYYFDDPEVGEVRLNVSFPFKNGLFN